MSSFVLKIRKEFPVCSNWSNLNTENPHLKSELHCCSSNHDYLEIWADITRISSKYVVPSNASCVIPGYGTQKISSSGKNPTWRLDAISSTPIPTILLWIFREYLKKKTKQTCKITVTLTLFSRALKKNPKHKIKNPTPLPKNLLLFSASMNKE